VEITYANVELGRGERGAPNYLSGKFSRRHVSARETRFAESLLNGVVRSVEDWPKPSFHRAGHHASLMHLAAHRKNSGLAFNRLVDLTECYARCRAPETDAAVTALAKSDQSLPLEELEDLPHHDRLVWRLFAIAPKSFPRRQRKRRNS